MSETLPKTRILVVDDEPNLSELVRMFLERTGRFEVLVENRSSNAVAAARRFKPEMVLLDVDMPGKDGGQIASEFRLDPVLRNTPVLFLTSLVSRAEAGERPVVKGDKRFLAKPVLPEVLIKAIDRILAGADVTAA